MRAWCATLVLRGKPCTVHTLCNFGTIFPWKSPQARPLETPLEFGDPHCPSSKKQTTFPRAGNLGQLIPIILLDWRFRHLFPGHFLVFRGVLPCKCDRGVLQPRFSVITSLSTT